MDFGAAYVLDAPEEEYSESDEENDPEEYEHYEDRTSYFECEVMDWSDEDEDESVDVQGKQKQKSEKTGQSNPNTVSLTMASLLEKPDKTMDLKDAVICKNDECKAAFAHINNVEVKDGTRMWACKFCKTENKIPEQEVPDLKADYTDVMYTDDMNSPPCVGADSQPPETKKDAEIIFVIDTSASMCQPVKGLHIDSDPLLKEIAERDNQNNRTTNLLLSMFPGQPLPPAGPQEATRLQAVKVAIIKQIEKLKEQEPSMKVGLITFSDSVIIYTQNGEVKIGEDSLEDKRKLEDAGMGNRISNSQPVATTGDGLISKIKEVHDEGRTALGPALNVALHMASVQGSKVILCTDGFANVGLGKIEDSQKSEIEQYYDNMINYGKTHAVSISIICCDEAGLDTRFGDVPSETGGMIAFLDADKGDLAKLENVISSEIKRNIIAVQGKITFIVHKSMYVKDPANNQSQNSFYQYNIGNILTDKRIAFSYTPKSATPSNQQGIDPGPDPSGTSQASSDQGTSATTGDKPDVGSTEDKFPFQVQIEFSDTNGKRTRRIWTSERLKTSDRDKVKNSLTESGLKDFMQKGAEELLNKKAPLSYLKKAAKKLKTECETNRGNAGSMTEELDRFMQFLDKLLAIKHRIGEEDIALLLHLKDGQSMATMAG